MEVILISIMWYCEQLTDVAWNVLYGDMLHSEVLQEVNPRLLEVDVLPVLAEAQEYISYSWDEQGEYVIGLYTECYNKYLELEVVPYER